MSSAFVRDLRDAGSSCGGKAQSLARLLAAGLPVPPGFVLAHSAFVHVVGDVAGALDRPSSLDGIGHTFDAATSRIATAELPRELEREVIARANRLGPRVVVRSSATLEDGDTGSAAGIFSSQAVPAAEVWQAIRMVWTSAMSPLAAAYARQRGMQTSGLSDAAIAIGVIVQTEVAGQRVTVYTRPPGDAKRDQVLVQRGSDRNMPEFVRSSRAAVPPQRADRDAIQVALQAEVAIGAQPSGADVELVQNFGDTGATWIVQARPIVHPAPRERLAPPPKVIAPLRDGRVWTWDVAHNPDPLSPAQIGLIERVEQAGLGAFALRVCAGYLYSTPRAEFVVPVLTRESLAAHAHAVEQKAADLLAAPSSNLEQAIERYLAFYAVWSGELAPHVAAARRANPTPSHRPSAVEVWLARAARGEIAMEDLERRLGDLAPAWDVAVAPFAERPGLLRTAVELFSGAATELPHLASGVDARLDTSNSETASAQLAAELGERDDLLFARAQCLVRRAMIARAHQLGIDPEDIFWLPLDDVVAGAATGLSPHSGSPTHVALDAETAKRRAAGARAAAQRVAGWAMPWVVGGPERGAEPGAETLNGPVLRGVGCGASVVGRVVRFASLAEAVLARAGDVVVVRAATPALAVFLGRCAALVSETGGLLDHGAAMARELGIPCVVGCEGAWTHLANGTIVAVDGDAGRVTPLTAR